MRAVVIYESMYGNTHAIADHIAAGLRQSFDVKVLSVGAATAELEPADLLVCGGPTHLHGMSSQSSRQAAAKAATQETSGLDLEQDASGPGLRDWLQKVAAADGARAAAFDTRVDAPAFLTGRASKAIARRLQQAGFQLVLQPQSFLVDKQNRLLAGEADRAEAWGSVLARQALLQTGSR